jgi:uncharacterized RDD family membrane protein YckC
MTSPREGYGAPVPAPLLRRFGAVLYEALLLAALVLLTGFVLLPITSGASAQAIVIARPVPRAISFAVIVLVVGVYCVHFWSNGRRTLPMKTWRLELVRRDGSALPMSTAIGRYAAAWVGPLLALAAYVALRDLGHARQGLWLLAFNYAWAFVDRERLFLHDRLAGTRIVAG